MCSIRLEIDRHDLHRHSRMQMRASADVKTVSTPMTPDHNVARAVRRVNNDHSIIWINPDKSERYAVRPMFVTFVKTDGTEGLASIVPKLEDVAIDAGFIDREGRPDFVGMLIDPEFSGFRDNAKLLEAVVWEKVKLKEGGLPLDWKFGGEVIKLAREMRERIDAMPYNGSDNITKLVWSFAKATSGLVGMTHSKAGQEIIDVSLSEAMTVFLKDNKYFEEDGSPMGYNPGVMTMIVNNIKEGLGMPDADKLNLAIDLFNPNTVR